MNFWESIKNSTDPVDFALYPRLYPQGRFAEQARLRLEALKAQVQPQPLPLTVKLQACAAHLQADRLTTGTARWTPSWKTLNRLAQKPKNNAWLKNREDGKQPVSKSSNRDKPNRRVESGRRKRQRND